MGSCPDTKKTLKHSLDLAKQKAKQNKVEINNALDNPPNIQADIEWLQKPLEELDQITDPLNYLHDHLTLIARGMENAIECSKDDAGLSEKLILNKYWLQSVLTEVEHALNMDESGKVSTADEQHEDYKKYTDYTNRYIFIKTVYGRYLDVLDHAVLVVEKIEKCA